MRLLLAIHDFSSDSPLGLLPVAICLPDGASV
ncbi:uncharacterized protein METZ01_LOCUS136717, partial [marine metagenome]